MVLTRITLNGLNRAGDMNVVESVKQGVRDKDFPQCVEQQVNVGNNTDERGSSVSIDEDLP